MDSHRVDFLVIGSGLAGLSYALRAAEFGTVAVLTKAQMSESNTSYAQGGIAAAVGEADSWELHEEDTLRAGAGLCDPNAVRFLVRRAPAAIQWLIDLGTRFDARPNGDLSLGREGGHSRNRIIHHQDRTGWEVERAMLAAVQSNPNIHIFEHAFVTSLLLADGRCVGAAARVADLGDRRFFSRGVMLATGGCGRVYQHTTNPSVATGDGIGLADAAGAKIEQMEFQQFHPTTLYHPQLRSYLISEAVRGAGATLRNHLGRRFMYDYDERLELAPRDVVARAIDSEMKKLGTWCVYLDTSHLDAKMLREEFPTIYERLASVGLEMEKEWIPVVPAQHYSCGGVVTDQHGQTTVPGLFAAGEVACTGVHGANRLASNSLLEAIVYASAAAELCSDLPAPPSRAKQTGYKCIAEAESIRIRHRLQQEMTSSAGIVRHSEDLLKAAALIESLQQEYDELADAPFSPHPLETHNLIASAKHIVRGAIARTQNVGLHYNEDLVSEPSPRKRERPRLKAAVLPPRVRAARSRKRPRPSA